MKTISINRRTFLSASAAIGGALMVPAMARAQATTPRMGGTIRVSMPYNPAALDPMTGRNLPDFNVLYTIFDSLIEYEPATLKLKPGLATAWKFTDPKTLVLDLIEGVEFHDGTPFDAEAAKFNLDRYLNDTRSNVKSDLNGVSAIEVTGKNQITMRLSKPNSGMPEILTNRCGLMVSPASIKKAKDGNVDRLPVGTGPFVFQEWQDNNLIKVSKNKNYWKPGLPYADAVELRIITELNTVARTVISGQSDIALNVGAQQKLVADRSSDITSISTPCLTFYGAFLNYGRAPLGDVRVRQAMNYAIDRDGMNQVVNLGLGEPTSAIFTKSFWACNPKTANYYNHDPERARKLLADAGFANGLDVQCWGWPDQVSMQRQEILISQLGQAGIRVKMTPATPPQAMESFMVKSQGAFLFSPQGALPDPGQAYERLFAKDALRNAGAVEIDGYRTLIDAAAAAQSFEERQVAYHKVQDFVVEQALQLPQFMAPAIALMSKKVRNLELGLLNCPKLTEVWLEA